MRGWDASLFFYRDLPVVVVSQLKLSIFFFHCKSLIDGAAFIGVGFDLRGDYSPESRKMSIIQRDCSGRAT